MMNCHNNTMRLLCCTWRFDARLPLSSRLKFRDSMHSSQDVMKIISRYRARVNAIIKRPCTNASTEVCTFRIFAVRLQYLTPTERAQSRRLGGAAKKPGRKAKRKKNMATGCVTGGGTSLVNTGLSFFISRSFIGSPLVTNTVLYLYVNLNLCLYLYLCPCLYLYLCLCLCQNLYLYLYLHLYVWV